MVCKGGCVSIFEESIIFWSLNLGTELGERFYLDNFFSFFFSFFFPQNDHKNICTTTSYVLEKRKCHGYLLT